MIPEYIEKLHDVYWRLFLPGLARCDPLVLECLEKAYCEIDLHNGRVLFKLPKLFHAVSFFGVEPY